MNTVQRVAILLFAIISSPVVADDAFRVAVLDFENQAGALPAYVPAAALSSEAIAEKGAFLLNKKLAGQEGFRLIDRRDFFAQVEKIKEGTPNEPSFLRAAQQLNADVVLRGSLLTLSTSRSAVHQGGYTAYLDDFTVRVGLEALDTRDGSVLAATDGTASRRFRQTDNVSTTLGEDDVLMLVDGALGDALPSIRDALVAKQNEFKNKPTVKISITTTADPALLEIDGMLIGSTPITDFTVYQGDHTINIDKPGYRDISKRILLENNVRIEVPMLKIVLDADQRKEILEGANVNLYLGDEPDFIIQTVE